MINLRKKEKDDVHVYTEALNDIMFFLMLFFIFAALMKSPDAIKINTPKTNVKNVNVPAKHEVILTATKDAATGAIMYTFNAKPIQLNELEALITTEKTKTQEGETVLLLKFDRTLTIQDMVDVMSISAKTGVKALLATQK